MSEFWPLSSSLDQARRKLERTPRANTTQYHASLVSSRICVGDADLHFADAANVNAARMELTQYVNEQVPIGARHLELAQSAWAMVSEDVFELSAIENLLESALTDATTVAKKAATGAPEAKSIAVAE